LQSVVDARALTLMAKAGSRARSAFDIGAVCL
jgi:hypothetical protein